MVNIDSLPKSIEYNGNIYMLDLHITAWNKLCVCYKYEVGSGSFAECIRKDPNFQHLILSQVVEPDCKEIMHTDDVTDIVDVGNWEDAFVVLEDRIRAALDKGIVKLYK